MDLSRFQGERNQIMERSAIEVAKRINKRSVEDRAVRKVTDKVDVQDVVEKIDPDSIAKYQVDKLVEVIGSGAAEQIIGNSVKTKQARFVDKLVEAIGANSAETIIRDKITDISILIDKFLEKNPSAKQKIIEILADPNNTKLIIKAFAEKYPEVDIESIIRNLQKFRVAKDYNVRSSLKQTEAAIEKIEEDQQRVEQANQEIKKDIHTLKTSTTPQSASFTQPSVSQQDIEEAARKAEAARVLAEQSARKSQISSENAENSAKEAKNSAESTENTSQHLKSNFERESSDVIGRVSRVRRSTEELRDCVAEEVKKAEIAQKWAEEARDEAKHSVKLVQKSIEPGKSAKIPMTAYDAELICKLERDVGNTIKITQWFSGSKVYDYDKVKVTTNSGHAIDIDIFDPLIYYLFMDPLGTYLGYVVSHSPKSYDVQQENSIAITKFLTYKDNTFRLTSPDIKIDPDSIKIDPKRILTTDGKPIDATQYTGNKKLELVQGKEIEGDHYIVDLYDYDSKTRGSKVGTLPAKFIAIDRSDSKVKLFTWNGDHGIKSLDINLGDYFTLKYKEGDMVGYFSDKNGTKDSVLDDEFKIDMDVLDFLSLVQVEELAQKAKDESASQQAIKEAKKKSEEAAQKAEQSAETAEAARDEAKGFASKAQNSAEVATLAKDSSINSLHEIAQYYSNLNRDKSDILREAHRIKRSKEAEDNLEKETSGISSRIKRDTENILDLSEGKMIQKTNKEVMQMKSSIENVSTQVEEIQEKIQKVEQIATKAETSANEMRNEIERYQSSTTTTDVNSPQEKKDQLKIIQSDGNSTEIKVESKGVIAKFSKVGYYFHNGQLHIHNPETQIDVAIPSEFNFLKVIEHSEKPTNYMLVLVNQLGNELFEHKKYDFTFSSLANEFKFIDSQQVKTPNKINFNNGLHFILKPGDIELSSSQNYAVDVYEIGSNKKIGTLIDEFCYYQGGQFHYINYHTEKEPHNCSHEHNLSIEQREDYQAKINIICGENNEKVASDVHPIVTSEFDLLETLLIIA